MITTVFRVTTNDKALRIATVKWRLIIGDEPSIGKIRNTYTAFIARLEWRKRILSPSVDDGGVIL